MPFVVTDPYNLQLLLGFENKDGKIDFYAYDDDDKLIKKDKKGQYDLALSAGKSLKKYHSTAFIDLSGDLRANIALHTESDSGTNHLSIYNWYSYYTEDPLKNVNAQMKLNSIRSFGK